MLLESPYTASLNPSLKIYLLHMDMSLKRPAVSSIVALLITIVLISSLTSTLLYVFKIQGQHVPSGVKTIEEISEKARENLKVKFWKFETRPFGGYIFYLNATNTGVVSLRVVGAAFMFQNGSITYVELNQPVDMVMLAERIIQVEKQGDLPSAIGLMTERGNLFVVDGYQAG